MYKIELDELIIFHKPIVVTVMFIVVREYLITLSKK